MHCSHNVDCLSAIIGDDVVSRDALGVVYLGSVNTFVACMVHPGAAAADVASTRRGRGGGTKDVRTAISIRNFRFTVANALAFRFALRSVLPAPE